MKTAVLVIVVIAALVCAAVSFSQGGPGGPDGPGGPGCPPPPPGSAVPPPPSADRIDGITQALSLTTDQAAALKTLLTTTEATIQPLMEADKAAEKALHDAFAAGDFDAAATLVAPATDAELALTKASLAAWAQIKSSGILTADQFAKLLAGPGPGGPPPGPRPMGRR